MPWRSPSLSLSPADYWRANHASWAEKRYESYEPISSPDYLRPASADPYSFAPPAWGHHDSYGGHPGSWGHHAPSWGHPSGASGWGHHRVRGYVGANAQESARAWIVKTDDEVKDIPVFEYALELQTKIFAWADELGVGDEVRTYVYTVRSFQYAGPVAVGIVTGGAGSGAAAGGAGALTITGGAAALGAAVVVVAVVAAIFGGNDTDVLGQMVSASKSVLHLRDRLTLAEFAEEQDTAAFIHESLAGVPMLAKQKGQHLTEAATARKLAAFYRKAIAGLDADERAAFESISNLSRWEGALIEYGHLPSGESYGAFPTKDTLDKHFGSGSRLPGQLKTPMEAEQKKLIAILRKHQNYSSPLASALLIGVTALAAGGALAAVRPDLAAKAFSYAKGGAKYVRPAAGAVGRALMGASRLASSAVKKVI